MNHIKQFNTFLNEGKDFEFSIFSIFKPLGRLLSKINTNAKLANIINAYDDYLYNVYIEYLERKKHISKNQLQNSDIQVIGKDNQIRFDDWDDDVVSNEVPDAGTNSLNDIFQTDKYSVKKTMNADSPFISVPESDNFAEMVDELVENGNVYLLNQMKSEYKKALKRDIEKQNIAKKDLSNLNSTKKRFMDSQLTHEKGSPEYNNIKEKIVKYNKEITNLANKSTTLISMIGAHRWYLEEIEKAINYTERKKREAIEAEKDLKNSEKEPIISNVDNVDKSISDDNVSEITESNDWHGGGIYDLHWTSSDMEQINGLVNSFQIEEFYLKAEIVINKSKDVEASKSKWNLYLNSLYKKWYYTFDVRNLRNMSPKTSSNLKRGTIEQTAKEELAYSTLILEDLFHNIKSYSYRFKMMKNDRNKYFILLSKNNMLLIKKVVFNDELYVFQLLSLLKPNKENNNIIVNKMLNTLDEKMEIVINDKDASFYKEKRNYPIFFIKDGNMYLTNDFIDYNTISLRNCNIYSLKDEHFKKIIKNSGVNYEDVLPSEIVFDKIKKSKL